MQAHQELEQKQEEEAKEAPPEYTPPFEEFYQAVIKRNHKKIKKILTQVGVNFGLNQSPILRLASENKQKEVNYLIQKFQASVEIAIEGYAKGGHLEAARALVATASTPTENQIFQQALICGLATAGKIDEVNKLVTAAQTPTQKYNLLISVIQGYGFVGNIQEAKEILKQANNKIQLAYLEEILIENLADAGFISEAQTILESSLKLDKSELNRLLIQGCGYSNKIAAGKKLIADLKEEGLIEKLIEGCAFAGNFTQARLLMNAEEDHELFLSALAEGAACGGYIAEAKTIISQMDEDEKEEATKEMLLNFIYHHPKNLLKKLNLTKLDDEECNELLSDVIQRLARAGNENESKKLILKARNEEDKLLLKMQYAESLAGIGFVAATNQTLQELPEDDQHILKLKLISNYIDNGYFEEANQLLTITDAPEYRAKYINVLVDAYSSNNCEKETLEFLLQVNDPDYFFECLRHCVPNFARHDNIKAVNEYIGKAETPGQKLRLTKHAIDEYFEKENFKEIANFISQAETAAIASELLDHTFKRALSPFWFRRDKMLIRFACFNNPDHLHQAINLLTNRGIALNELDRNQIEKQALVLNKLIRDYATQPIETLIKRSEKIQQVMQNLHLSYEQALAWTGGPAIQEWVLQPGYKEKISKHDDIFLHITTFLSNLDLPSTADLCNKASFYYFKDRFFNNLSAQNSLLTKDNMQVEAPNRPSKLRKITHS